MAHRTTGAQRPPGSGVVAARTPSPASELAKAASCTMAAAQREGPARSPAGPRSPEPGAAQGPPRESPHGQLPVVERSVGKPWELWG